MKLPKWRLSEMQEEIHYLTLLKTHLNFLRKGLKAKISINIQSWPLV